MNILDENVPVDQRQRLLIRGVRVRQIGHDIGSQGMKDREIIPWLQQRRRSTLLTLDADFYDRRLCYAAYCLAYLNVADDEAASVIRRFLKHTEFDTQAKRMGTVVRLSHAGIRRWRRLGEEEAVPR